MSYLVTRCGGCGHVCLIASERLVDGAPACSTCGCVATIVPSCAYGKGDISLFEELSQTVKEGAISPLEAARLTAELTRSINRRAYDEFFELLSSRMPAFTPIQLILGRKPHAQLRALRMLATIFEAIAASARATVMPSSEQSTGAAGRSS